MPDIGTPTARVDATAGRAGEALTHDDRPRRTRRNPILIATALLCFLALVLYPIMPFANRYYEASLGKAMLWAILAVSLGFLIGQSGLVSFGHAAWYGFGAYLGGLINIHVSSDVLVSLVSVSILAAVVATGFGVVLTRLSGISFAILTLAFGQVVYSAVFVFSDVTGGEDGLNGVPLPTLLGFDLGVGYGFYLLILSVVSLALLALYWLASTPMGGTWAAIRENEPRARFIGIGVHIEKLVLYVLTSVLAAMAGALYVAYNGAVAPDLLHWQQSGEILMAAILGGTSTVFGPAVGGVAVYLMHQIISTSFDQWLIVLGVAFVVVIILMPQGIGGLLKRKGRS